MIRAPGERTGPGAAAARGGGNPVAHALERAGWRPAGDGVLVPAGVNTAAHPAASITLRLLPPWHGWQRVQSSAFRVANPSPDACWRADLAPPFPAKLVPEAEQPGWCRLVADWPRRLPAARALGRGTGPMPWTARAARTARADAGPADGLDPADAPTVLDRWAQGLTAVVRRLDGADGGNRANRADRGEHRPEPAPTEPEALVEALAAGGWTALVRQDHVQVNIERGHRLHRVRIGPGGPGGGEDGVCLEAELGTLEAPTASTRRAAATVARAANLGMALIRVVHRDEEGRRVLLAQAHLGGLPPVVPWIHLALDAHRVAAGNLVREFASLADPVVARWINRENA